MRSPDRWRGWRTGNGPGLRKLQQSEYASYLDRIYSRIRHRSCAGEYIGYSAPVVKISVPGGYQKGQHGPQVAIAVQWVLVVIT